MAPLTSEGLYSIELNEGGMLEVPTGFLIINGVSLVGFVCKITAARSTSKVFTAN